MLTVTKCPTYQYLTYRYDSVHGELEAFDSVCNPVYQPPVNSVHTAHCDNVYHL